MDTTHFPLTDLAALVEQLDADAIRQRIDAIDREREALKVLLRAALRAQRETVAKQQAVCDE